MSVKRIDADGKVYPLRVKFALDFDGEFTSTVPLQFRPENQMLQITIEPHGSPTE